MTRVNSAIPVKKLTDEHLLSEHREIKRLTQVLKKSINNGNIKNIPDKFTLGKGHVMFFLDKMKFIKERYLEIYNECLFRGFNIQCYSSNFDEFLNSKYFKDYLPTDEERLLLTERISTRLKESKKKHWCYCKNPITKEQAIELLK